MRIVKTKGMMVLLLWMVSLFALGCGKKASPVPWESIVPMRIVDLEATPREGRLMLAWTVPKQNTDKSVLTDLASFQIYRSEAVLTGDGCRGCGEKPELVHEVKVEGREDLRGKRMTVFFDDLEVGKVYVYAVCSVNRRKDRSSLSNPVEVLWDHAPHYPSEVKAEAGDRRVELSWKPVEDAGGYNVYRRQEGEGFPLSPLNRDPLEATWYTDFTVENEKTYLYSIRAVRRVGRTNLEGQGSPDVSVTPTDLIPPAPPIGLVAIPLKEGMELNWRKNREPDLLGYHVYRRSVGEKEFQRLTESPIAKETYLDPGVTLGQDYEYAITAVDRSKRRNESPFSEEVRVRYIR